MIRKLGLFRLADSGYAVPLSRLLRVVDCGYCAPLPLIPEGMAGMLVLDDEVVPLLDSDWLPGVAADMGLSADFKVLIATEYGPVALPADATVGIVAESRCELVTPEQETADFFSDSVSYHDNRYHLLSTDLFITSLIRPER
jgi:chemotaxis signal transduction protein